MKTKFIKILIAIMLSGIMLTGCAEAESKNVSKYFDKVLVAKDEIMGFYIYCDKNTGVMYYHENRNGYTPIYNADGTLKLYEGY